MKVALIQMDIVWGDVAANIATACKMTGSIEADLFVLPEMWSTGYSVHPEQIAEEETHSVALEWMRRTAREKKCALCGSLALKTIRGDYCNRFCFVTPDGVDYYDKRHLFTFAHEDRFYTRGSETVVVSWKGMRILLQVCYDLRFPVWSRYGRAGEYDAIVYVANWPDIRQEAWNTLLRARAIENQCYVVAVNRVGTEHRSRFTGGSVVISPQGHVITDCQKDACVSMAEIDVAEVYRQREVFPVLDDRDVF